MNGLISERQDESINEWTKEIQKKRMYEKMNGWMNELMNEKRKKNKEIYIGLFGI